MSGLRLSQRSGLGLRLLAVTALLASVAGCATHNPQFSATQEAAQYAARARRTYTPPGPPSDPWGPYVTEASARFDVPVRWVRSVMRQESGGQLYENGQLITSSAGAMGLMQVMPGTFDELRVRYSLGQDPYDPHDNILAGTAYIRELYDVYGSPGFLAAYNAGPGRLDDYLTRNRPLPAETRTYVARIGPNLGGDLPNRISDGQNLAMNQLPMNIPAGPRFPRRKIREAPVALASNSRRISGYHPDTVQTASLPEPPVPPQLAAATPTRKGGFRLISQAMADTLPMRTGGPSTGAWAVQVGAFANQGMARTAAEGARAQAGGRVLVGSVQQSKGVLYRARVVGLSHEAAVQACGKIRGHNCIVLSPAAQG